MSMISFTTISELISHLRVERAKGERFATRFILVQGCQAWDALVPALTFEVDRVIRLSDFCSSPDTFPNMTRLETYLKGETAGCSSILLTPLAECIRLDPDNGEVIRTLAQWPAGPMRRIYVPLLAAEEFFFPEIERVSRHSVGLLPEVWYLKGEGHSEVIVAPFFASSVECQVVRGIREYLNLWEQSSLRKVWLVTAMAPWLPVRKTRSECRLCLYPSSFDYIYGNIYWEELRAEWGTPTQWDWLAEQVQEGDSLDRIAGRVLNVAGYNADQLFTLWQQLDEYGRWLVWLWSRKHSKAGTYLHHILSKNDSLNDFSHDAVMAAFMLPRSVSVSRERKELLRRLGIRLLPADFWARYRELADPLDRVAVLTDLSVDEREELVRCTGELLTKYPHEVWWEYLEVAWPELTWYLQPAATGGDFVDRYFAAYNRCRLKDRPDEELTVLIGKWAEQQLLWGYPGRSDLLARERGAGATVLWVDAMGVEWSGLLTQLLTTKPDIECEVWITRGHLPTTTEANKEWEAGEDVLRGLDDIAHHYDYRFPEAFLKEVEVIKDVADKALALLAQHPAVVITSDHGLSRFAATGDVKVDPPPGAQVDGRGRFALLPGDDYGGRNNEFWIMEEGNAYLLTHDRFKGGSACRGEVHSGASPEEYLVPVIVVRKTSAEALPRFEVVSRTVRLNPKGEGTLTLRCSRKVANVELRVAGHVLFGLSGAGFTWSFGLKGWKAGSYTGRVHVANRQVGEISFDVVRGLIRDDLGL